MWAKRRTAPVSEPANPRITRRALMRAGAGVVVALAWPAWRSRADSLPPDLTGLLDKSLFVYVSPLKRDGAESRCHGEVWFGWLDGGVVLITAKTSWKARSLESGLALARVWVGDHGRVGGILGGEAFRKAPSFEARARLEKDAAVLDRLMALYRTKYPDEIEKWEPRMRSGFASGERVLIRYAPA